MSVRRVTGQIVSRFLAAMGRKLVPFDTFVVPLGQSIYDPAVFGTYDLATQRIVTKNNTISDAFSLDALLRRGATALPANRYRLALDLLTPGSGICLDACTTIPLADVRKEIEEKGYTYRPIDIEGGPGVLREDLTNLTFADGSIARILSLDTLEHIPDYSKALREMRRVLAPNGIAIVHVPVYYFDRPHGEPIRPGVDPWGHLRYFSARELLREYDAAGFAILRAHFNIDYGALLAVLTKRA